MAIYTYKCKECSHKFEKLVLKPVDIKCPKCGSKEVKKIMSVNYRSIKWG